MAIVQISRIQNRRGRELTETGLPQLAGGELGWAVDTQKLYVGNGSVSEGSPAVGNTNILTEHSDIFALANQYVYKETSNLWGGEAQLPQSLQTKLDQIVTVFDFGVVGDGAADDTLALQVAIDSLYLRALDTNDRVALHMPAGEYRINGTIYIPPFVTLFGDGIGKTVIVSSSSVSSGEDLFVTISGAAQPGSYNVDPNDITAIDAVGENQARHIFISDMTIQMNRMATALNLENCSRSVFRNLRLEGNWLDNVGDPLLDNEANNHAIALNNSNNLAANTKENTFENIQITKFYDGVYDITATNYNRRNKFMNCDFSYLFSGISLGIDNESTGPSHCLIHGCTFDKIAHEGILITRGEYNISSYNRFFSVGNGHNGASFGTPALATYNNIKFTNDYNNTSTNDYFARTEALTKARSQTGEIDPYAALDYVAEVGGRVDYTNGFREETTIGYTLITFLGEEGFETTEVIDLLKVPLYNNGTIEIDYVYVGKRVNGVDSEIFVRKEGTIYIHVHSDDNDGIIVNDEANFQGDSIYDSELEFGAYIEIRDNEPTMMVTVKNLIPVEEDKFTYKIRVKS